MSSLSEEQRLNRLLLLLLLLLSGVIQAGAHCSLATSGVLGSLGQQCARIDCADLEHPSTGSSSLPACGYRWVSADPNKDPLESTQLGKHFAMVELDLGSIEAGVKIGLLYANYSYKKLDGSCRRFFICPTAPVTNKRLRLQLHIESLADQASSTDEERFGHTVFAAKSSNHGGVNNSKMCLEQPQLRLLAPLRQCDDSSWQKENSSHFLQIGFKDPACLTGRGGQCHVTAALLDSWISSAGLHLLGADSQTQITFPKTSHGWRLNKTVVLTSPTLSMKCIEISWNRPNFKCGEKELIWPAQNRSSSASYPGLDLQLLAHLYRAVECPSARPTNQQMPTSNVTGSSVMTAPCMLAVSLAFLLASMLATRLAVGKRNRHWPASLLLIGASSDILRHDATVRLRRHLQAGSRVRIEQAELSQLTPGLTRSHQPMLLISRDASFADFAAADQCRSDSAWRELATVLQTERHRAWRLYLEGSTAAANPTGDDRLIQLDGHAETVAQLVLNNLNLLEQQPDVGADLRSRYYRRLVLNV